MLLSDCVSKQVSDICSYNNTVVAFIRELTARGFLIFFFKKLMRSDHLGITLHVPIRHYIKSGTNLIWLFSSMV